MAISRLRRTSERGAIVIQVAVALLILLAFTAFILDYGVMWASRGQAQTAADSGALGGCGGGGGPAPAPPRLRRPGRRDFTGLR